MLAAEAEATEAARRDSDPAAYEMESWERDTIESAAALRPGQTITVELLDGRTIEVRPPKALAWITAAVKIQRCLRPLAMVVGMLRGIDNDIIESAEGQMLIFERMTSALSSSDVDVEATLSQMLGVVDAFAGQADGWSADQDIGDVLAVAAALVRVIDPGRYAHFFGQARAAVAAHAAAARCPGRAK